MNNIIDYFTGKTFEQVTKQDTEWNDARTDKYGVYIGNMGKGNGADLRKMQGELEFLSNQIDYLNEQYEQIYERYYAKLSHCLGFFSNGRNAAKLNLDKDTLMISCDGHAWIIYADKEVEY